VCFAAARESRFPAETQTFSVRFTNAAGAPAAGEAVSFSNDACGTYPNGLFNTTAIADADGIASATFTARPQGIVCHMLVSAGASVTFTILTYLPANLYFEVTTSPAQIKPGQSFGVTVHVHDPVADPQAAVHEYGVALTAWDDLPRADAIVAAVPHNELRARSLDEVCAKVAADGLYVDVKSQADAGALRARGVTVWRL